MNQTKNYKYHLFSFIGVTMAIAANVRSVPTLGATGWALFFYVIFCTFFFALPICLIAGEFGSTFPGKGGPQLWVTESLGDRWGFVIAWMLWAQSFPAVIMITSTLGPLIGEVFGEPALAQSHWFAFGCILVSTWIITLLSFNNDVARFAGTYGVWIGVYIPAIVLIVLGFAAFLHTGLNPVGYLGHFTWGKFFPHDKAVLKYFSAIVFVFAGLELTSVYIPELQNSKKNYLRGILLALTFIAFLNMLSSVFASNAVPKGRMELANVAQPIIYYCHILHLPGFIANIFSLCVAIGVIFQMASWLNGPCHTMSQAAREGNLPARWGFHKTNDSDISKNLLWVQIIVITIFSLFYAFLKNVNAAFLTLTNATNISYMFIYFVIVVSILVLRYKRPDLHRPNRVGKKGNWLLWIVCLILSCTIMLVVLSVVLSAGPTDLVLIGLILFGIIITPIIINRIRKEEWRIEAHKYVKEHQD